MLELRPYQQECIDKIVQAASEGHRRIILSAFMGSGKTVIAGAIAKHAVSTRKRVLFIAHTREIIWQAETAFRGFGLDPSVMISGEPYDPTLPCKIASVQTMHSWVMRRKKEPAPLADLVIADECHRSTAKTWSDILALYPEAYILGLSATPVRQTGKGLGHGFDTIVQGPSISYLTDNGYLVPVRYFAPSAPDLAGLKIRNGDYADEEVAERVDRIELIGDILKNWSAICPERQTLVFAANVKHSLHICESFNAIGIKAKHIDADTDKDERDKVSSQFANSEIQVISNVGIYTEGTDLPCASALIFARPTKSLRLYLQVSGRVLRPFEGKKDAIFLDHACVLAEHGPIEQEWDWQLDYSDYGTAQKKQDWAVKKKTQITCSKCKCVYSKRIDCPECGTKPLIRGKPVETYEAYLQEISSTEVTKERTTDKQTWLAAFMWYARSKGYKDGWVSHKMKEKFGTWPMNGWQNRVTPVEPPIDVRAWIRSRQIAWSFAQKKQSPTRTWQPSFGLRDT